MFERHWINYDIVNQQDFLGKGWNFRCNFISNNRKIILDFDIFEKNQLFQYVVMVQVIINIYVFIQLMIIHQRQRAILFILRIQWNHNSIETNFSFFFFLIICECRWDKETDDVFFTKNKKRKNPMRNLRIKEKLFDILKTMIEVISFEKW